MQPETEVLTCDWRDPEAVEALLEELDGLPPENYWICWNEQSGTYDVEIKR